MNGEITQVGLKDWLRRLFQPKASVPDGWTDDMSVQLPRGHKVEKLVDYILLANQQGRQHETLIADLVTESGLSDEDAELSVDRVGGGIVRAATGNRANCPNRAKDPIAWVSFQRAITKR
jgi:hypothetical protein